MRVDFSKARISNMLLANKFLINMSVNKKVIFFLWSPLFSWFDKQKQDRQWNLLDGNDAYTGVSCWK
uniref:Uncharacterized protein n=1 Tax=Timema bartmani TaxID=61472 RepID=A0A7R9EXK9_9NEOP|nr:unnamed protein product [Timema bartmani]